MKISAKTLSLSQCIMELSFPLKMHDAALDLAEGRYLSRLCNPIRSIISFGSARAMPKNAAYVDSGMEPKYMQYLIIIGAQCSQTVLWSNR